MAKPKEPPKKITPEQYAKAGTEHAHQVALFMWAREAAQVMPDLRRLFAIPNGGLRHPATAARLKAEGVKDGVPDLFLPVPRGVWHGLFIEMKRPADLETKKRAGQTQSNQDDWREYLIGAGYGVATCYGWIQARETLLAYMATH